MYNRKDQLEKFRAAEREQQDFLNVTVAERKAADPSYDFRKDESYVKRMSEISDIQAWLQADKESEERLAQFDHQVRSREDRKVSRSTDEQKDHETRQFADYMRHGDARMIQEQRSNLASNGTTTGGYLVPTFVSAKVIQDLAAFESVRKAGAEVMPVIGNTNVPILQDPTANFIQEAQSITASDPTFARVQITPNLLVAKTTFSWQLLNRSAADLTSQIQGSFVRAIAKKEAAKFLYGSGTNEPGGLVAGGTVTTTTASTTTFTRAELMSLYSSIDPIYAANGTWIMGPGAAEIARGLESTNGQLIWVNNMIDGTPTLYGRPVVVDSNMNAATAALKPVVFADVFNAYLIGEETSLTVFADPYTAAGTGESKLYVYKFVDGKVKKSAAAQVLLMHA